MKNIRCLLGELVHAINNGPKGYKSPSSEKARATLRDEWLRGVLKDMDPLRDTWLLKICDGERHRVGEIYEGMDNILGKVKDIIDDGKYNGEFTNMVNIMVSRWDKMTIPLHCLGFAFTHCFYDHAYLNAPALGGYVRRAPI
ncbi:unnamed protein product [Amaranthus hypochondriacus]